MTWEEKFDALNALSRAMLGMNSPGRWYVSQLGVDIKDGGMIGGGTGHGDSPQAAVEEHWRMYADPGPGPGKYLVIDAFNAAKRRAYRWNGYRWEDVPEPDRPVRTVDVVAEGHRPEGLSGGRGG